MSRFVRSEPVAGSDHVALVWDETHEASRAQRTVEAADAGLAARIRAVAKVRHPNLVALVAVSVDPQRTRIVTEWLPGAPIRDLTPLEGVRALHAACNALEALHDEGLAHGGPLRLHGDAVGRARLYRAGVVAGTAADDLRSFGALVQATVRPPLPAPLQRVATGCRGGLFPDAAALRVALTEARRAIAPPTMAPAPARPEARGVEHEERLRLGWLAMTLLSVLLVSVVLLVSSAAALGWWQGAAP